MNELLVISLIFIQILMGYIFSRFLLKEQSFLDVLPISFGIGVGISSYILFLFSILKVPWSPFLLLLFSIVLFILYRDYLSEIHLGKIKFFHFNLIQKILIALNVLTVGYTFIQVLLRPLYAWDGWAIWLLKSKVFYYDRFLNPEIFHQVKDSYPYILSLNSTFYYLFLGRPDDKAVLIGYFAFYLMSGLAIYTILKKRIGFTKALIASFLFYSLQNVIRHGGRFEAGYSDLALGFYIFIAFLVFKESIMEQSSKLFFVLGVVLGITSLVKQEGLLAVSLIISLVLYSVMRHRVKLSNTLYIFWGFIPLIFWIFYKWHYSISYSLYENFNIQMSRFDDIVFEFLKELLNIQNWNLLWIVFLISLPILFMIRKIRFEMYLVFTIIIGYAIVFLGSPHDPVVHIPNTINRLFLHIVLLCIYLLFIAFHEISQKNSQ